MGSPGGGKWEAGQGVGGCGGEGHSLAHTHPHGPKEAPSVPQIIKGCPPPPSLDLGCLDGHRRVGDRQGKDQETPRCLARRPECRCQWRPDKQVTQSRQGQLWPQGLPLQTQHPANSPQELEVKAISS